jgi:hypothetical protein
MKTKPCSLSESLCSKIQFNWNMYSMIQNFPKELWKYGAHLVIAKLGYHQIEKHSMT